MYSNGAKIHKSIILATRLHGGQKRKCTDIDYISHPMEVYGILAAMGADEDLQVAGVLHDTVEDCDLTIEHIAKEFGDNVAALVQGHTEDKSKSWVERKSHTIQCLINGDRNHRMLVLADSLSNLRSMELDYELIGEELWDRFNAPKERQSWYYFGMNEALSPLASDPEVSAFYEEMTELCKKLYQEVLWTPDMVK